jgi:hypothetical protein
VRPSIADESKILSGWRDGDDVDAAPRRRASAIIAECDAAGAPGAREPFARLKDGPAARLAPDEEAERLSATPAPPGAPGRWVQRASLPIARSEMNWAAAWAGRMHVIGGYGEGRVDRNYHQVYDPATDRWFVGAPLPRGANHVAVAAFGGRVYALGGFIEQNRHSDGNAYAYDVATDRWTTIAPLSRPRGAAGAVALAGHIHVIGGATEPSSERASIGWHEAYDPQADRWQGRKIGTVRQSASEAHREPRWDDVSKTILERMRIDVVRINWFSTYHVHHRVTSHFRKGRAFLLGDAAHIHSPVGGQGMNTGIGDAINLAWKLAAVLRDAAAAALLDSYEPERIRFARRLVATTDRVFTFVTRDGAIARFMRLHVAPRVIPAAFALRASRRYLFRTVSQIVIKYAGSTLSEGTAGAVTGGDRLPWIRFDGGRGSDGDNFAPLATLDWQLHVYGEPAPDVAQLCNERQLPLHAFAWHPRMRRAGVARNALYLVRPDGYVALADRHARAATLRSYLDTRRLRPFAVPRASAE